MDAPTQEEKDEQRLREVEGEIKEVLDLMARRVDRDQATKTLGSKRKQRDDHQGVKEQAEDDEGGEVFSFA